MTNNAKSLGGLQSASWHGTVTYTAFLANLPLPCHKCATVVGDRCPVHWKRSFNSMFVVLCIVSRYDHLCPLGWTYAGTIDLSALLPAPTTYLSIPKRKYVIISPRCSHFVPRRHSLWLLFFTYCEKYFCFRQTFESIQNKTPWGLHRRLRLQRCTLLTSDSLFWS